MCVCVCTHRLISLTFKAHRLNWFRTFLDISLGVVLVDFLWTHCRLLLAKKPTNRLKKDFAWVCMTHWQYIMRGLCKVKPMRTCLQPAFSVMASRSNGYINKAGLCWVLCLTSVNSFLINLCFQSLVFCHAVWCLCCKMVVPVKE